MRVKDRLAGIAVVVSLSLMLGSGCASSPVEPSSSAVQVEQVPITSYMQSRVGTPDELSPIAPPEARKVRKVGDRWTCEINGQPMVYNDAASRWEPQSQADQKK
jgi:hypothetical protein